MLPRTSHAPLPTARVRDPRAPAGRPRRGHGEDLRLRRGRGARAGRRERRVAAVDQVLGLITVLLGFAVLIALLGITNTLALSIVERTREIGLLRAVGMTRRQLSWLVRAEPVLVAAVAAVVGLGLGLGLAAATLAGLSSDTPFLLRVPAGQLAAVAAVAVLAGLAAGLLPARRAGRLDVLTAIAGT